MNLLPGLRLLPFALLLLGCSGEDRTPAPTEPVPVPMSPVSAPARPPRYDGVYLAHYAGTVQLLRFFPAGTVVTATDRPDGAEALRTMLREDLPADVGKGIHNVPVTYRNDSVLFRTTILRGYIEYGGVLMASDSLRLLKHSLATGKRALLTYGFTPDGTPLPKE